MTFDTQQNFKSPNVLSTLCPSRNVLKHITSQWGVLIFVVLKDGHPHRFSTIRNCIHGISEKMLAQTLKHLVRDGFVQRIPYQVTPPKVEYQLTQLGRDITPMLIQLVQWIEDNMHKIKSDLRSV